MQAKIHIRLEQYKESFKLLAEAIDYFTENNGLEVIIAHLWWVYGAWLGKDETLALSHLQEALAIAPILTAQQSLIQQELKDTISDIQPVLDHFAGQENTPVAVRTGIEAWLVGQP